MQLLRSSAKTKKQYQQLKNVNAHNVHTQNLTNTFIQSSMRVKLWWATYDEVLGRIRPASLEFVT